MATKKKKVEVTDPSGVVKGSHLTVTTFSDGTTKLDWDDEALLRDVREALASVSDTEAIAPTKPKRKAKAPK